MGLNQTKEFFTEKKTVTRLKNSPQDGRKSFPVTHPIRD
jgi:hypothetical protein